MTAVLTNFDPRDKFLKTKSYGKLFTLLNNLLFLVVPITTRKFDFYKP